MSIQAKSINYHLTKACNMQCKFCFATFNDIQIKKYDLDKAKLIISEVAKAGFEKITFAGGEPTLINSLPEIVSFAKDLGLNTTIVTNGYQLIHTNLLNQIEENLDWLALSIDSIDAKSNALSGRMTRGRDTIGITELNSLAQDARAKGIKIKINTVVSKYNLNDNLQDLLDKVKPDRWKIFQAMPVNGQNSKHQNDFIVSKKEYQDFLWRHMRSIAKHNGLNEPEILMRGSYYMIAPNGRLFDSTLGHQIYSREIMDIGLEEAIKEINFNYSKFLARGGEYDW